MDALYITTAIPYVNAAPHLGHALELVETDVLARHARSRGRPVRFLTGTDDHAAKNVAAAAAEGVPVATLVATNARRFAALREPLGLSNDDFLQTSTDVRHRPAVERLWARCAGSGDLFRKRYEGLFCSGCEQFVEPHDLIDGVPGAPASPRSGRRGQLVLPVVALREAVARRVDVGTVEGGARGAAQRGARVRRSGPARLQCVAPPRPIRRLGHPRARRSDPDHLRVVRRARQLHQRARVRQRRGRLRTMVEQHQRSGARRRQGHPPLSRDLVARDAAVGRCAAPDHRSRCTTTSRSTERRSPSRSATPSTPSRSSSDSAPMALADLPVDAGVWSTPRIVTSPTVPATSCAGSFARAPLVRRRGTASAPSACGAPAHDACGRSVGRLSARIDHALERFDFRGALEAITETVGEANRYLESTRPWARDARPACEIDVVLHRRDELPPRAPPLGEPRTVRTRPAVAPACHVFGTIGDTPPVAGTAGPRFGRCVGRLPRQRRSAECVRKPCLARRNRSGAGDPSARPATSSPMSGANLKPCPEHGEQMTTGPVRSTTKSSLVVEVYRHVSTESAAGSTPGIHSCAYSRRGALASKLGIGARSSGSVTISPAWCSPSLTPTPGVARP